MTQKHAKLSPSAAVRWMQCPASLHEERSEFLPQDDGNDATRLGSSVHAAIEQKMKQDVMQDQDELSDEASVSAVEEFIEYVNGFNFDVVYSEKKVWIKEQNDCWGTADIIGIKGDELYIIDFKYGLYPVFATYNKQLMIYACAAMDSIPEAANAKKIKMIIYQPRIKNVDEDCFPRELLLHWKENVLLPAATAALSGVGDYRVGDHCKFCKARTTCKERNSLLLGQAIKHMEQLKSATDEEEKLKLVDLIMENHEELNKFLRDVKEFAHYALSNGKEFKSVYLANGRKQRYVEDEIGLMAALLADGYKADDFMDLKTVAQLEKEFGKARVQFFIAERVGAPVIKRRK